MSDIEDTILFGWFSRPQLFSRIRHRNTYFLHLMFRDENNDLMNFKDFSILLLINK